MSYLVLFRTKEIDIQLFCGSWVIVGFTDSGLGLLRSIDVISNPFAVDVGVCSALLMLAR